MKTPGFAWLLLVVVAAVTVACGDSKSSLNPTAPSAVSSGSLNATADDAVESGASAKTGNGNGNSNGNGNGGNGKGGPPSNTPGNGAPSGNTSPSAPGQAKVEFEGLLSAVNSDSVELNGQKVLVNSDTIIRHGNRRFELSDLRRGDRVHVRAERLQSTGVGAASLRAVEIKRQNPGDEEEPVAEPPAPTGLVSVAAADALADEWPTPSGPDTATFRLTRVGDASLLAAPLSVTYTLDGTATNGSDYTSLPLTATFAAGAATTDVVVTPLNDNQNDGEETVVLTLTSVTPYDLGSPLSAAVTIAPAPTGAVSVTALDGFASEQSASGVNTGTFRLTRTGDPRLLANALTVSFSLGGTAGNGSDYTSPVQATFSAGTSTVDVGITPLPDGTAEGTETVVLTLTTVAPYEPGSPASASLSITDAMPIVTLFAPDSRASETNAADTALFRLVRTGDLSVSLTVEVVYSGTATHHADYDLPTTFTFAPNAAELMVVVTAINDGLAEFQETVTMTVSDGAAYDLGTTVTRTINIVASSGT